MTERLGCTHDEIFFGSCQAVSGQAVASALRTAYVVNDTVTRSDPMKSSCQAIPAMLLHLI
jgi:hypothetical protein